MNPRDAALAFGRTLEMHLRASGHPPATVVVPPWRPVSEDEVDRLRARLAAEFPMRREQ